MNVKLNGHLQVPRPHEIEREITQRENELRQLKKLLKLARATDYVQLARTFRSVAATADKKKTKSKS